MGKKVRVRADDAVGPNMIAAMQHATSANARLVTDQHPDIATTTRAISKRAGKVYVDAFQNRAGQLMVAPYSVRPSPKAPVSMPIEWDEINGKLHNSNFTIANALKRMEKLGQDPVLPVLDIKPNLVGVLERLNERLK